LVTKIDGEERAISSMDDIEDYYTEVLGYEKVSGKDGRHVLKKGDDIINIDATG
jgi:catechol-2,3-dioxygenase